MKKLPIVIPLLVCLASTGSADAPSIAVDSTVDWRMGVLIIDLVVDLVDIESPAAARTKAEELVKREIGAIFCDALYEIVLDSHRTIKDVAEDDPEILLSLLRIGNNGKPKSIHMNTELDKVIVHYEYYLFPNIMRVFTSHRKPYRPKELLRYVPSIEYSGIVIYAKGEYTVHGESLGEKNPAVLVPSLRPRIFDTNMLLVAEPAMIEPDVLAEWGIVAYTDSTNYLEYKQRVGALPLLTMARAIFGENRTDILIPEDAVKKILSNARNRELIRQGRILIISDLASLSAPIRLID